METLKYDRTKKPSTLEQEKIKKAKAVFSEFQNFTSGVRTLFLIHRNKEGGATNNSQIRKCITRTPQEFYETGKIKISKKSFGKIYTGTSMAFFKNQMKFTTTTNPGTEGFNISYSEEVKCAKALSEVLPTSWKIEFRWVQIMFSDVAYDINKRKKVLSVMYNQNLRIWSSELVSEIKKKIAI